MRFERIIHFASAFTQLNYTCYISDFLAVLSVFTPAFDTPGDVRGLQLLSPAFHWLKSVLCPVFSVFVGICVQ
jgi:hypothetical protein